MRLDAVIPAFLSHCESERRLAPLTIEAYSADLDDFGRHVGLHAAIEDISEENLKDYLVALNTTRALSIATVRRRFATLKGLFKWAAVQHAFANPFVSWSPKLKRPKRLPRALHRPELSALMEKAESRARRSVISNITLLAVALIAATGLRVSETCALALEDVTPDGAIIRVKGKGARDRIVYVSNAWLLEKLASWRTVRAKTAKPSDPLFVNRAGRALTPPAFRGRLRRLTTTSERRVTPHMLRHTAATLLIEAGVDIRIVQRLLGHASIATTEIYTHVADELLRRSLAQADVISAVAPRVRA